MITGSVLVTGGTGSFGQAFCRHLLTGHKPKRVVVFSRDEHKQANMAGEFVDGRIRFFIGDVRDRSRLRRAFDDVDIVVHAAALKRIETGWYNPSEMVATNILGAMNVIEAAMDAEVERVVALSTDKAWQPISPYGQSKALAETLFRNAYRSERGPIFAVTRYGNVWRSNGSVVPKWLDILRTNDTVPVTDPGATRFYMTMQEAVDLVVNTIETMRGGELRIPTLPAYRLGDLAEAMGAKMRITGLPEFEKLHEGMCDGNTSDKARRMSVTELGDALENNLHRCGPYWLLPAPGKSSFATRGSYRHRRGADSVQAHTGGG